MLLTLTTLIVSITSITIGLLVFFRNYYSAYNVVFALFAIILGIWVPANFFGSYSNISSISNFLFHVDFFLAPILALLFALFGRLTYDFYKKRRASTTYKYLFIVLSMITVGFLVAVMRGLVAQPIFTEEVVTVDKGAYYTPYIIFLGLLILFGLANIIKAAIESPRIYKVQSKIILWGLALGLILLVIANVILPNVTGGASYASKVAQQFSYFGVLGMLIAFSYSIVKYRLFDIRLIIARSLAYAFSISLLIALYAIASFGLFTYVISDIDNELITSISNAVLVVFTALTYGPTKVFFDRVTNKLFYRDAYDPQVFVADLNKAVVGDIEIFSLLRKVIAVIEGNLKAQDCVFIAVDDKGNETIISKDSTVGHKNTETIDHELLIGAIKDNVIVGDFIDESAERAGVKRLFSRNNISAIINLSSNESGAEGKYKYLYMLIGHKKSGNPFSKQDERMLRIASNELLLATQNALRFEEISQFNITLQKKIEDATRDLQRSNTKLKALDEAKDDFISMASHQLRTPLTSVKGYLSMVLDGDAGPVKKEQKALLEQAFDSSQRMVYLISDLLNVSRLRTGKFIIENGVVNLADLVQGEIEQLQKTAASRHLTMSYDHPKDFPDVMLDETKIRQVIMNFLDNAIYYTPAGGHITVAVKATPRTVEYTVTDTGLGVPATEQKHLFTKFFRAGNAKKMRPDGTGLGLYMAKKVIVAQGGAIIFKSQPGKGSTFGFSFALSKVGIKN